MAGVMLTLCAWCEREGRAEALAVVRSAVLGESISHGICQEHLDAVLLAQRQYSENQRRAVG